MEPYSSRVPVSLGNLRPASDPATQITPIRQDPPTHSTSCSSSHVSVPQVSNVMDSPALRILQLSTQFSPSLRKGLKPDQNRHALPRAPPHPLFLHLCTLPYSRMHIHYLHQQQGFPTKKCCFAQLHPHLVITPDEESPA